MGKGHKKRRGGGGGGPVPRATGRGGDDVNTTVGGRPTTALVTMHAVTSAGKEARVDAEEARPQLAGGGRYQPRALSLIKTPAKLWSRPGCGLRRAAATVR